MESRSLSANQINIFLFKRCISAQSEVNRRLESLYFWSFSNRHKQSNRHNGGNDNDNAKTYVYARCLTIIITMKATAHCSAFTGTKKPGVWQKIGSDILCDTGAGEKYLEDSSRKLPNIEQCTQSCDASVECLSITFLKNGWCSHFSTWCTKHTASPKAVSMRWDISGLFFGLWCYNIYTSGAWNRVHFPQHKLISSCSNVAYLLSPE